MNEERRLLLQAFIAIMLTGCQITEKEVMKATQPPMVFPMVLS